MSINGYANSSKEQIENLGAIGDEAARLAPNPHPQ